MTDKDPNALKIASFRTKEGVWSEFCNKAESIGWTATDVLKAAMEQFIAGEFQPTVGTSARHHDSVLTRHDVLEIVNTAIMTLSIPTEESIHTLVNTAISTTVVRLTEQLAEVKEELKKFEVRSVVVEKMVPTSPTPDATAKPKYPDGITKDNRAYYNKLVGKPELIKALTELFDSGHSNKELVPLVLATGLEKAEGIAYDETRISSIRKVVNVLIGTI